MWKNANTFINLLLVVLRYDFIFIFSNHISPEICPKTYLVQERIFLRRIYDVSYFLKNLPQDVKDGLQ